jgi:glutathione synthase
MTAMRVLVVMDPVHQINPSTDTTLVLVAELHRRGHLVDVCGPEALEIDRGEAAALAAPVTCVDAACSPCIAVGGAQHRRLADYDALLMRKDPPFDQQYYFYTLMLEQARGKTLLVNDPRGLREANEKLYIFNFPSLIAPTCVARTRARLRALLGELGGQMIVKPLDRSGGGGVFHVRADDRNTNAILETVTNDDRSLVMAQAYLPQAREGDKRILLLDGEPIGAVLRVPREDETRANLHVGGRAVRTELSAREREICATLAPRLRADGLYFVGIDVIGGYLTEVNVTSPTGVQEIDRLEGVQLERRIIDWLEHKVAAR